MDKTILFVDDESAILNSIKRVFRKSSHTILTANSGEDALEIIRTTPVSVLVSDYSMPGLTGAMLLAEAKSIRPETVRIILSGNNDQTATIESLNTGGASRFLTKPWDETELINEVESALNEWESSQYAFLPKKLLNPNSIINSINDVIESESWINAILVCIGLSDIEQIKHSTGVDGITGFLTDLSPSNDALGRDVKLALTDDHHFCALIKPRDDIENAQQLITSVLEHFPVNHFLNDQKVPTSFDIGYTVVNDPNKTANDLLGNAYTALQQAKSEDSAEMVLYTERMGAQKFRRLIVESNLSDALANQEFVLHYQPKINLTDGSLYGAEALIRWDNSLLGLVPPFDFIPLAETSRLIYDIGQWVMADAFHQWGEWYRDTTNAPVISVNVSPKQLKEPGFIKRVESVLSNIALNTEFLEIEITENLMVDNLDTTVAVLNDVKQLGLKISIDDFGTGYSSLSYLNRLPADIIKIDRSFIFPMLESKANTELVNNLIKLGHDVGMQIVAEGVENEDQLLLLRDFGCDVIQGYYYSPPIPASDFWAFTETLEAHARFIDPLGNAVAV